MKLFKPTEQQKKAFKQYYLIYNQVMVSITGEADSDELTKENFRALYIDSDNPEEIQELTIEDFAHYNPADGDYDFQILFANDIDYVERNHTPKEVRDLLDAVIRERVKAK